MSSQTYLPTDIRERRTRAARALLSMNRIDPTSTAASCSIIDSTEDETQSPSPWVFDCRTGTVDAIWTFQSGDVEGWQI